MPQQSSNEVLTLHDRVKIIPLEQGIIHVLLSRPDKLNSLDIPMFEAIANAAHHLKHDRKNLRAVIISGEGRAFCTGLDAKSVVLSGGISSPSSSLKKLLDRPSAYGGENGLGNLAQDVCYLWR
jgi:enoyl-CoA hydratase/carnithine racemase